MAANTANGGRREEKGRNIQVVVRCRPFNMMEKKTSHGVVDCDSARKEVAVKAVGGGVSEKSSRKTYTFDMVFGAAAKQIEVYRSVVCPILDEVIMGYNCTVFAYGQTGTGKTFTMEGERTPNAEFTWEEDPLAGIIPRTLHQIFEKLSENNTEFSVKVSLLEIYNEELFDLLSPTEEVNERLQLYDDPRNKRGVVVKGLEEVTVHNKDEVYQILERGAAKRKTASTLMNAYSSRSHSVFSVTIHMKEITLEGEELVKIGKLNLVDLAGSENIGRSGAVDKRAREAGNINQSLLTLGRVITALVEKRPHIPYRESKLTRILQDSLGGRTKTSIIATISPSSSNLEETLSTLEYANRAKNIMNKPEVNQKLTKRTLIKEYTEEIERLKRDLTATRDKNGVYLSAENYETMQVQLSEYVDKIAIMEEELKKVSELFEDSRSQLERCTMDLEEKQNQLEETSRNLHETKEKLIEEEMISSELNSVQLNLYNTAGELLSTVDQSTTDLSGMHDKLDRRNQVEKTNRQIQQDFAKQMNRSFSQVLNHIQNHKEKQQHLLGGVSQSIAGLVQKNEDCLAGSLSSLTSLLEAVVPVVVERASRCRERVQQQGALSQRERDQLLQLLEEHHEEVKEELLSRTLVGVAAVQHLSESLRASVETQRALAQQVEALRGSSEVLVSVIQDVGTLRQDAIQHLQGIQEQNDKLQQEISRAQQRHQEGVNRTLQVLKDQMQQLAGDGQEDFTRLGSTSRDLQEPLKTLQQDLSSGMSSAEERVSSQAELLSSSSLSLSSSLRHNAQESQEALEETATLCRTVSSSISGLVERDLQWTSRASEQVLIQNQEHKTRVEEILAEALSLQQEVEQRSLEQSLLTQEKASAHCQEVSQALLSFQEQTGANQSLVEQQGADLAEQVEESRQLVQQFLQEHLQQDVPTGTTPQRRDFLYPRQLTKCRDRSELLESLRMRRHEEEEEAEEEEDKLTTADPNSVEDEASNDSVVTEPSFIDENLVFNEAERVPFFKKKGGKKETNKTKKGRVQENEATPIKSRLPLRCQN